MPEKINAKSFRMHRLSPPNSATKRISTWAIALPRYLFQKIWNNTNGYFPYTAWNAIQPSFPNWNEASITKQWWPGEGERWVLSLLTLHDPKHANCLISRSGIVINYRSSTWSLVDPVIGTIFDPKWILVPVWMTDGARSCSKNVSYGEEQNN